MISKQQYVDKIINAYVDGTENAYEVFIRVYTPPHEHEHESDLDFIRRCAEQDYDDAAWKGALYQELLDS